LDPSDEGGWVSQSPAEDRSLGRLAYWAFGLIGSIVLAFADLLVRAGSIRYTDGDLDEPLHVVAFIALLVLAGFGVLGVPLARSRPGVAMWLLRLAGLGAVVASLYAVFQSHPLVGFGLLVFSAIPLLVASWSVGWAEAGARS
jgi:hypothetical protein